MNDDEFDLLSGCVGGPIVIETIDELRDTYVTIGCYRETGRLDRCLRVFQKAMTLARRDGHDARLSAALKSLHDHKGSMTVEWHDRELGARFGDYVNQAWADEGEVLIRHLHRGRRFRASDNP